MGYNAEDIYKNLGRKIRVFRNRAGLSQLSLEVLIGASPGVISRIESGVTNPSKETLFKIEEVLKLNTFECDYLYGKSAYPASDDEISNVVSQMNNYFESPMVFGYLIDDRNRLVYMSKTFRELTELSETDLKNLYMRFMTTIVTYNDSPIKKFLDSQELEHILYNVFSGSYREMYFMEGDEMFEKMMEEIKNNELAFKWWKKVSKLNYDEIRSNSIRTVPFEYKGHKIKMTYSMEPLWFNQRFRIVEYTPHNIILKAYKKLIHNNEYPRK